MNAVHINYLQEWVSCGKPNCRCGRGEKHGPYWYAYWCTRGRRHRRYIGKAYRELGAAELAPSGSRPESIRTTGEVPAPQSTRRPIHKRSARQLKLVTALPEPDKASIAPGGRSGVMSVGPVSKHRDSTISNASAPKRKLTRKDLRAMAIEAGYPPDRVEGAVEWASILAESDERTIGGVRVVGCGQQGPHGRVARAANGSGWFRFTPNRHADGPALWVKPFPTRKAAKED